MMIPAATDSVIRISRPLLNTYNVSGLFLARSRREPQQNFPAGSDQRAGEGAMPERRNADSGEEPAG